MVKGRERDAAHKFVCVSPTISDGERHYVKQRKEIIHKWLNSQGIDCELADVPHIALLGSGGGERAAVGLLGSLKQLGQDDMLDGLLYMCGVSGSTWSMSSLYNDPEWSENGARVQEVIATLEGPPVDTSEVVSWLRQREQEDPDFSLTDVWGALTASRVMKEMHWRVLSADAQGEKSTNPYPIYTAIDLDMDKEAHTNGVWFEMTPHESGFSGLDAFVCTSHFRSKFKGGDMIERMSEMDMILLQGICGSAVADGETNKKAVSAKLWSFLSDIYAYSKWFMGFQTQRGLRSFGMETNAPEMMGERACVCEPAKVLISMFALMEYREDPEAQVEDHINTLGQLLKGQLNSAGDRLWNMDVETWQKSSQAERLAFIDDVSMELIVGPDTWAQNWKDHPCFCNGGRTCTGDRMDPFSTRFFSLKSAFDVGWVAWKTFRLVREWKWGTTSNFLYQCKDLPPDTKIPSSLLKEEKVHLIDAGLKINSPYPPVLRPAREVDLIISLDFSAGNPFETLFNAQKYAKRMILPFPNVEVHDDQHRAEDCYVFHSRRAKEPTVMHLPLFNMQNCQGEKGIKEMSDKYGTFQPSYGSEQVQELLSKAQVNMRNTRQRIMDQIKAAVDAKRQARNAASMAQGWPARSRHKRSYPREDDGEDASPRGTKRASAPEQAPQCYYLMPMAPNSAPVGPNVPCWPQTAPGPSGWYWGGQQAPPAPPPTMPFPGYCMMPMASPAWPLPAHSAP